MYLSIITVNRNLVRGLESTLDSIFHQTFKDFEVIVIDGASTDGSVELLQGVTDSRLSFVSEPDTGIYNAMNKGINLAKGDYVYFLNAGDTFFAPDSLNQFAIGLKDRKIGYGNIHLFESHASSSIRQYPDEITNEFWTRSHLCHQAVVFHRSLFERFGPYNETFRFAADFDFLLRVWNEVPQEFIHIDVVLATYNMEGTSSQLQNRTRIRKEFLAIQRLHFRLRNLLMAQAGTRLADYIECNRANIKGKLLRRVHSQLFPGYFDFPLESASKVARPLRILHLSTYADGGGAGIAAHRLHQALLKKGVHSLMLVKSSTFFDPTVVASKEKGKIRLLLNRLFLRLETLLIVLLKGKPGFYSGGTFSTIATNNFFSYISQFRPDVIHLHWISGGYLRIKDLERLPKPISWTFHDMWPFLGVEHIAHDDSYQNGFVDAKDRQFSKIDRWVWKRKKKYWGALLRKAKIVTPSIWMQQTCRRSPIFSTADTQVIPNIVDSAAFEQVPKTSARCILGVSDDGLVVIFGAGSPFLDPLKGYSDFLLLLEKLKHSYSCPISLITFGSGWGKKCIEGVNHKHFEFIYAPEFIKLLYSAADVTIVMSRVESFCLVAAESLSCGTPVACYDTSGLKDVVVHKQTGYRAVLGDPNDLVEGIKWIVEDPARYEALSTNARRFVRENFDPDRIADLHVESYKKLSKNSTAPKHTHRTADVDLSCSQPHT